jgi:Flp pilus assembly protein TadG
MQNKLKFKDQRGAELIEFAFVLPLLLLLSLGAIEFGRAYFTYNILTKALRDGARYAATSRINSTGTWVGTDNPSVITRTRNLVTYGNPAGSGSKIIPNLQTNQVNVTITRVTDLEQYINVSVAYPYAPLFSLIIPTTLTLSPNVRMQFIGQIIFPS